MSKSMQLFFAIGSPYAFLGLDPIALLSKTYGVAIVPRPTVVIMENGGIFSKDRPEPRRRYWLREIQRWAAVRGKTVAMTERAHLSDPTPAAHMVIAAATDGRDWLKLTLALQTAFWSADRADIGKPEVRVAIADMTGLDGKALLAREQSADVQERWNQNRADAAQLGVFGVPTIFYDGELYWGQDNLEFLERHLRGEPIVVD